MDGDNKDFTMNIKMYKLIRTFVVALLLTVTATSVHATLMRYDLTTDILAPTMDGSIAGYIEFDSSVLTPGASLGLGDIIDFSFTWGSAASWSQSAGDVIWGGFQFDLDALLNVSAYDVCVSTTGACFGEQPIFRVANGIAAAELPNSTIIIGNSANNVWTGPSTVSVPEPFTLAIFALGIIGLASRRFKKQ